MPKTRGAQETFDRTGGLHASALFDGAGNLLLLREDVGLARESGQVLVGFLREKGFNLYAGDPPASSR